MRSDEATYWERVSRSAFSRAGVNEPYSTSRRTVSRSGWMTPKALFRSCEIARARSPSAVRRSASRSRSCCRRKNSAWTAAAERMCRNESIVSMSASVNERGERPQIVRTPDPPALETERGEDHRLGGRRFGREIGQRMDELAGHPGSAPVRPGYATALEPFQEGGRGGVEIERPADPFALSLGPGDRLRADREALRLALVSRDGGAVIVLEEALQTVEHLIEDVRRPKLEEDLADDPFPHLEEPFSFGVRRCRPTNSAASWPRRASARPKPRPGRMKERIPMGRPPLPRA